MELAQLRAMVRDLLDAYVVLNLAQDADGLANLFAEDGVITDAGGNYFGRDAIRRMFEAEFKHRQSGFTLSTEIYDISPESNHQAVLVTETFTIYTGDRVSEEGNCFMYCRLVAGELKITTEIVHMGD